MLPKERQIARWYAYHAKDIRRIKAVTMLSQNFLCGSTLFFFIFLTFPHTRIVISNPYSFWLFLSFKKALLKMISRQPVGVSSLLITVYVKKYVAWLHVPIALCASQASHNISQTICSDGISIRNEQKIITVVTRISANSKLLQIPFSFSKHHSLACILMRKHILFKFTLPFQPLSRSYKRIAQP